jgi:uncharacterized sulfatase
VSSADLFPTILRAAGIEPAKDLPGVDLTSKEAVAGRKAVFGEIYTHDLMDLNDPAKSLRWRWIVRDGWKLIVPHAANEPDAVVELYQISTDEHEKTNLADKEPERVKAMSAALDAWWTP